MWLRKSTRRSPRTRRRSVRSKMPLVSPTLMKCEKKEPSIYSKEPYVLSKMPYICSEESPVCFATRSPSTRRIFAGSKMPQVSPMAMSFVWKEPCTCVRMCVGVYICIYIFIYVCIYIYMCICMYIHTYIHAYIHTHLRISPGYVYICI